MWMIDIEDEVNRVLFATPAKLPADTARERGSSLAALRARCSRVSDDLNSYFEQLTLL